MKIIERVKTGIDWIRRAVTQPQNQLTEMQNKARNGIEVLTYCARHLREDRAPVLAAALSFRTLFGLLPVLVVATVTARRLLGENFPDAIGSLLDGLGLSSVKLGATAQNAAQSTDLRTWLQGIVQDASNVNLSALGWVGGVVVGFSAIWLLVAIETAFNTIYRAPTGRSWPKRVVIYWFLLTCGPLLLICFPWLNSHFTDLLRYLPNWAWLATLVEVLAGILVIWLFTLMVYAWVPNTTVQYRAAMIGALVTALLLEGGKRLLGLYTTHALTLNQLYGSLGLIPLFMFWVYMMWIFVLFGLEVSSIVQVLQGRSPAVLNRGEGTPGMMEPSLVLRVLERAGISFDQGSPLEVDQLANDLGLPNETARTIVDRLVEHGYLSRLEAGDQYALARPLERIEAEEVLAIGFSLADEASRTKAPPLLGQLRDAQASVVRGLTVRTALEPAGERPIDP